MSKLLRSLELKDVTCCWQNNISSSLRAISVAVLFVLWGAASAVAQGEFPCEVSISCPSAVSVECGSDLENFELTGYPVFDSFNCFSDEPLQVTHVDAVISEGLCSSVIVRTWTVSVVGGPSEMCSQTITIVDTEGPVFSNLEDVTVQCLEEGNVFNEATAWDACSGEAAIETFETENGRIVTTCCLTTANGPGPDWALWLPTLSQDASEVSTANWIFDGCGHLDVYADGTAHIYGTVHASNNPNQIFDVSLWLENQMGWGAWEAMGRDYKNDLGLGCANIEHINWNYYELVGGFSTLTGHGDLEGDELYLYHMPSSYFFGFQHGVGANNKNCNEGISGWFTYEGFVDGSFVEGHGDVNADAACEPVFDLDCTHNTVLTHYYRAEDACGHATIASQTVTVHDTTKPVFVNCPASSVIECDEEIPSLATNVTATDNCTGLVTVTFISETEVGDACDRSIIRIWEARDICNNFERCIQTIQILDTTAPAFDGLPEGEITVQCDAVPAAAVVTATDNCQEGAITVSYEESTDNGYCVGYYTIVRHWSAADTCGNVNDFYQTINVVDTQAPVWDAFDSYISVECDVEVPYLTATDNCGDVVVELVSENHNSGGCLGVIHRIFSATDECGNTSEAEQFIALLDTTDPVLVNVPAEASYECSEVEMGDDGHYFTSGDVYGMDNCELEVNVTYSEEIVLTDDDCEASFDIIRTWVATDYCDNMSDSTQLVHIVDTTAPMLYIPADYTAECSDELVYDDATATDNCSSYTISVEVANVAGNCPNNYYITRTFVATDACGNASLPQTQTITVQDTTDPTFNQDQAFDYTYECDEIIPVVQPVATDNCSEVIVYSYTDTLEWGNTCYYGFNRVWTATDECGNSSTFWQNIYIQDTTGPVITGAMEIDRPCDDYAGTFVEATDNCNTFSIDYWDEDASGSCAGNIIRHYTAYDICQNASVEFLQIIHLTDIVAPYVVEQSPDQTIECGDELPMVSVIFDDNCDEDLDVTNTSSSETIDCITYVTYTFTAVDHCDNSTSEQVVITIIDTVDPYFMELPLNETINCDDEVPAILVPMAYDVCDQDVDVEVTDDIIPGECDHEYTIARVYRAYDDCGNEVVETRYIYVVDVYAPVFDEQQDEYAYECDQEIPVITPTALDNCDLNFDLTHEDMWEVVSDCYGYMVREWTAVDDCGNTSYFYQYISIYDETAPVIAGEFEIEMPCDDIDQGIFVTATDNCDEEVSIILWSEEIASGGCAGRLIRVYRAYDECENMSEFTQFITLTDTEAPVASSIPVDATYECDEQWSYDVVTFTDNCDMELTLTPGYSMEDNGCTQVYHYTWTAVDHCLNTTTVTQNITVTDTTPPTVVEVADITVECGEEWSMMYPSFDDNCDDDLTYDNGSSEEMVDCNRVITFWWTATDNCNNSTYSDWVVTIEDTTDPIIYAPQGGSFSCEDGITYGDAYAEDACDEDVALTFTDEVVPGLCPQSYSVIRTWVAVDDCENTATVSVTYNVYDETDPEFTFVPDNMTLECDDLVPASNATAEDNCDLEVVVTQNDEYMQQGFCYTEIRRTFTATDDCGNMAYAYQYFYIYDTTAPVITGEVEIEMPCDEISSAILVTATDNCDLEVEIQILSDELASGGCAGRIIRTYRAWDNCENYTDFTQFITLTDNEAPVASIDPQDMTVECGTSWSAAQVSFTDNCDEELTLIPDVFITTEPCTTSYHYVWIAIDHCENATTVDQWIYVVDTIDPMIYDEDSETTVECNVIVDFVIPEAYDVCDESVVVVPSYNELPGECPGEYTEVITFTATDDCGNSSTVTHIVHHVDNTAPMLENIPADGEYSCDATLPNDMPTAFDYCSNATVMMSEVIVPGQCPNSYEVVRTFWAIDECLNESEPVSVYYAVYDNTDPEFTTEVSDEEYQCLDWASYVPQAVSATDNCGDAVVTHEILPYESDDCGNGWWYVVYTATDLCYNTSELTYWIYVNDTEAPVLSDMPANLVIDCGGELPEAPMITATDNCTEPVVVSMTESCSGECPDENGNTDCKLITPVRPANNPCVYPVDWAMALFAMPNAYKWYALVPNSGVLTNNPDGSVTVSGSLVNVSPSAPAISGGFNFEVSFSTPMDWAEWSSQAIPTGFKDDCGGVGANHEDWMYQLLQAGPGAELVGWGSLSGSSLNLTHAPANNYFGFQMGVGANNYNAENGFGGWFNYNGTFLYNGEPVMSGTASGAGDFAFEVDCCPDYVITRCWTAMDCSGNETSWCQTITFGDLNVTGGPLAPMTNAIEADKGEIAIVSIMPNPANQKSQISFVSKEAGRISLQVMDMTGRIVADLYNNTVEAGVVYKADFDTDRIPSGMYMVRLNSDTESDMDRIQIAK